MNSPTSWEDAKYIPYASFEGKGEIKADVVIVGGGLAGIFAAYFLTRAQKKVILLEKSTIGSGYTACTTAFLTQSIDTDTSDLINLFGKAKAKLILNSHMTAIDLVESIVKNEKIDCEFKRCSNYIYANSNKDLKYLAEEADALISLGVDVNLSEKGEDLGIPNCGYIEMRNQAKFHPMKFLYALAQRAEAGGAQIFENSEVTKLETFEGGRQRVWVGENWVDADHVIVATYKPFNNPLNLYFKKGTYVSYVLEMEVKNLKLRDGTYEDTENPYHYFRVDGNRVIIGGEDHREDIPVDTEKAFGALSGYADTIIPKENRTITKEWNGLILEPIDGLPVIGQINEDHVYYALGFSGNGMTYAIISGMIFKDVITGSDNSLIPLYHPRRHMEVKTLATKAKDYAEELIKGAVKTSITQKKNKKK
jgi:glycine/D-amino acid oxidase-like deaminating enzyme